MATIHARRIAGTAFLDLELDAPARPGPAFLGARLVPSRGLMLLQARIRLADGRETELLAAPPAEEAATAFDLGSQDIAGNASFRFGAAVLAPYANRIRGAHLLEPERIEARVAGHPVRLPANGGGRAPGAERYAIHGLILATAVSDLQTLADAQCARVTGRIEAGDFGVGWPSATTLDIAWELRPEALTLRVTARNSGHEALPVGLGWHPYFALPSGRRAQARLHLPAAARLPVHDYDAVLPTGEVVPVAGTSYDFRVPGGVALGERFLDDCFVELDRMAAGEVACEVLDPAAGHGVRIISASPRVSAIQTYAPPDRAFVVVEPQFNWADPYGDIWSTGRDTGMALLQPGEAADYTVRLELLTPS
jgi:galactose mutarotase-like enzyme